MTEEQECEENRSSEGTSHINGISEKSGAKYNPIESMHIGEGFGDTPITICPED